MKKALTISIAKTLFTLEEDAYVALDSYLASVRKHFAETLDVVGDIESRIAEQLLETNEKIITLEHVERVIASIGRVEDFDDSQEEKSEEKTGERGQSIGGKKLYRDGENAILGGVCSGLAAYLAVDVVWIRILFVLLTIANGIGILIYIVMWLSMPEAKTKSQKLEMTGSPITLETLSESIRERVNEIENRPKNNLGRALSAPFRALGAFLRAIFKVIPPVVRILVGVILTAVSVALLIGTMITGGFIISDTPVILDGISLSTIFPGFLSFLVFFAVLVMATIPLLFIFFAGLSLLRKKRIISGTASIALLGIWFFSLLISAFGAAKGADTYRTLVATSPEYAVTTASLPLSGNFNSLQVEDGLSVIVIPSSTTTLEVQGRSRDISRIKTTVENGKLTISREKQNDWCIFCSISQPTLTLRVQDLNAVEAELGSAIRGNLPAGKSKDVSISLRLGSAADLEVVAETLRLRASLGSNAMLKGAVKTADISLENGSRLEGTEMEIGKASVSASLGSQARIRAADTLNASASNGSNILYEGAPEVTKKESTGSTVRPYFETGEWR